MSALSHLRHRLRPRLFQSLYHSVPDLDHDLDSTPTPTPPLPPLLPSPQSDTLTQLLIQHHNPYHPMESSLQLQSISLTPSLIHQTLLRLSHHSKISLSFFKYTLSLPHSSTPLVDSFSYNILVDTLSKVRQFDVAWQLILQMPEPKPSTFLCLIRRLVSAGLTRSAVRAFYDMDAFLDQRFDFYTCFTFLLDTLCKYGYVRIAVEVFNKEKCRVKVDVKIYTVLIYGWCKIGRVDMARRFLEEMWEKGVEGNVVTYNVLLNGVCRRASLHPENRFEKVIREAEGVLEEMRGRGLEPDVTSYSILLHVYSRAHKPVLCLEKLGEMKGKGIWPSVATYTSVIKCLCSCGRMEDGEVLLDEMVRCGVSPNAETCNCFLKEYRGRGDVEGALRFYKRMREEEGLLKPDMHTFNILLGMFLRMGKMGLVWEIWEDMRESGVGPDLDAYTMLVHGLCEKRKWRQACEFFVEMIEKGFLPQTVTFETLYRGLIQADMLKTWRRLKKKLEEEAITFGSEFQEYHLKPYKR